MHVHEEDMTRALDLQQDADLGLIWSSAHCRPPQGRVRARPQRKTMVRFKEGARGMGSSPVHGTTSGAEGVGQQGAACNVWWHSHLSMLWLARSLCLKAAHGPRPKPVSMVRGRE